MKHKHKHKSLSLWTSRTGCNSTSHVTLHRAQTFELQHLQ